MKPKELYYFLGKCLVLDEAPGIRQEVRVAISKPSFPWENFVQMGSSHLVLPALYTRFRDTALLPSLPEDLAAYLKEIHQLNADRNEKLLTQINSLHHLLRQSGIGGIFLKGAGALLEKLYDDPGERILSDIDCLVPLADLEKAVKLLKAEGYAHAPFRPENLLRMHHYPSLFKAEEPARIEIHMLPVKQPHMKFLNLEAMVNGSLFPDGPEGPGILSLNDQILVNVIHSQLKDRGQYFANVPLRNIYEFHKLISRNGLPEIRDMHPRMRLIFNNYMAVAQSLFSPSPALPVQNRIQTRCFLFRFNLNKTSHLYHRSSRFCRSLADLLFIYFQIIAKALIKKEHRRYLGTKLRDPSWYRHHRAAVRRRF